MKYIALTKGKQTIVDDDDYKQLSKFKWRMGTSYAVRWEKKPAKTRKMLLMHRVILKVQKEVLTDHINGNKLDNRKQNLRTCNRAENEYNKLKIRMKTLSRYKGVSANKGKWKAYIYFSKRQHHLGFFNTERQAALMYDFWATELFGQFARTNFKVVAQGSTPVSP